MFAIVKDNEIKKIIYSNKPFIFEGKEYTGKWSSRWSDEDKESFGIKSVVYDTKDDERFYSVTPKKVELIDGVPTQTYNSIEKNIEDEEAKKPDGTPSYLKVWDPEFDNGEGINSGAMVDTEEIYIIPGLKTIFTEQTKQTSDNLLQESQWMITRKEEEDIDVPENVISYREAVIAENERVKTALAESSTFEEVVEIVNGISWPKHYDEGDTPIIDVENNEPQSNTYYNP